MVAPEQRGTRERRATGGLAGHESALSAPTTTGSESLLMLTGAYTAVSPWVVGFADAQPLLSMNNLVLGLIVTAIGLGLTGTPERSGGISWTAAPIGAWLIIATWVTTVGAPTAGMIWNNVVVGALSVIFGLLVAGMVMVRRPGSGG
ncbi:SPW repeat-containing protein [Saccharopolyspora kobensis]|uniref:SPW repeat-containing protein n=2 Tax=Saccharopolyspora kobensis TaxID=146035 RepID=A0A1H6AFL3_9PSEU|nr:SPW repeat-containing protein [Saccharopolyspora kobensis]SFE55632.1 SPW repeat-containing protein [Saccharopolyspora kobensis]